MPFTLRNTAAALALCAVSSLGGCKREAPKAEPAAVRPPVAVAPAPPPPEGRAEAAGPMALAFQKVDYLAKDIPLLLAEGTATTLGAEARGEVIAVIPWASINCGPTFEFARTVASLLADVPGVQFMPVSVDLVRTDDERQVLNELLAEAKVEQPLVVDRELKLFALINARWGVNRPDVNALRFPAVVLISRDLQRMEIPELQATDEAGLRLELAGLIARMREDAKASASP